MRRRTAVLVAGVAAVVVGVPLVAYGVVAFTNRDAPPPAALGDAPRAAGGGPAGPSSADGVWAVADVDTNFVGYRIRERLGPVSAPSDAVGRTSEVTGSARIEDGALTALDVTVDLGSLDSDSPHRDDFVRDEALEVVRFPTGRLRLPAPVALEESGDPHDVVTLSLPAELTLRDETREVTFTVEARWNGPTIQAAGSTRIQRGDFGIDVSSRAGFNIDEEATIEFELTFAPEGSSVASPPPTLADNPATGTDEGEVWPPCQGGDPPPRLDPPVLVSGAAPGSDVSQFEVVSGPGPDRLAVVQATAGLPGGASWSPDGSRVVYSAATTAEDPRTLAVVPAGGGMPALLPGVVDAVQPDWGPGDRIVYVQRRGDDGEDSDIWVVGPDGSDAHVLVETPGLDSDPRWTPDSRSVVFVTTAGPDNQDVVVVGSDGRGLRTLVSSRGYEYAPSITPDGERVLFVRDGAIHSITLDGNDEQRLTDGPSDTNPALSPAGDRLAFIREGSLFVANPDGSAAACVETTHTLNAGPRWRPN